MEAHHIVMGFFLYFHLMKIFNLLRFKMVEGKRFKNYLIYAIGEIILVVVGILIALYINGVQQENAYNTNEHQLLKDVYAQLIKDKADISKFIERVEARNASYAYFKKVKPEDAKFPMLYELERSPLKIDPVVESIISSFSFKRSQVSLKLNELLTNYKYAQNNIKRLELEMNTIYLDYSNYLGNTYDWYTDFSFDNHIVPEATAYFLKDKEYKAFIARMNTISSKVYITELESLVRLIAIEMSTIKTLLDELQN